jgi:hypothetical protein
MRKLMWSDRTAVFISTGTCTNPKVSDPFQIDAISGSPGGWSVSKERVPFVRERRQVECRVWKITFVITANIVRTRSGALSHD